MTALFTKRQGEYLAFILRFASKHGVAPSFEEIGSHFGTSAPSVNGMIKTLERRGLLSRVPGAARSLRVLVPASQLPDSDFGSRATGNPRSRIEAPMNISSSDAAFAAASAVIDVFMGEFKDAADASIVVLRAAGAVQSSLTKIGLSEDEAQAVARRVAAEVARIQPDGRGVSARRRKWRTR